MIGYYVSRESSVLIILVIGCIWLSGCKDSFTTDLDIEEDLGYTSKLGLSGTLLNDYSESSSLPISSLLLTKNQSILDTSRSPDYYNSDHLDLYKNDTYFNTFTNSDLGIHCNQLVDTFPPTFTIEPANYKVEVNHPELGTISAETQMPQPIYVKSIEVKESNFTAVDWDFQKRYDVIVQFEDPLGDNYYEIDVASDLTKVDTIFYGHDSLDYDLRFVHAYINSVSLPNAIETREKTFIFDDSTFDGTSTSIVFSIFSTEQPTPSPLPKLEDVEKFMLLKFSCLSKEQYNFETSYFEYQNNQIFGPFSEPISLYNNVENGLGYLGAINYYYAPFNE